MHLSNRGVTNDNERDVDSPEEAYLDSFDEAEVHDWYTIGTGLQIQRVQLQLGSCYI